MESKTIKHVISSEVEAEVAGLILNAGTALEITGILTKLCHLQPPILIKKDNATAAAFVNDSIHQKYFKTWACNIICYKIT